MYYCIKIDSCLCFQQELFLLQKLPMIVFKEIGVLKGDGGEN